MEINYLNWADYQAKYPLVLAAGEMSDLEPYLASVATLKDKLEAASWRKVQHELRAASLFQTFRQGYPHDGPVY